MGSVPPLCSDKRKTFAQKIIAHHAVSVREREKKREQEKNCAHFLPHSLWRNSAHFCKGPQKMGKWELQTGAGGGEKMELFKKVLKNYLSDMPNAVKHPLGLSVQEINANFITQPAGSPALAGFPYASYFLCNFILRKWPSVTCKVKSLLTCPTIITMSMTYNHNFC